MSQLKSANLDVLRRPRLLLTIVGTIVLAAIWYLAWWSPEGTKLASVQAQQLQAQQQVASLDATLAQIDHENQIVQKYQGFLTFFGSEVPVQPEQGQLVYMLGKLERSDNVNVTSIDVSSTAPPATGSTLSTIPITLALSGPHDNVMRFLADLYALPRLITIQSVAPSATAASKGAYDILGHDGVPFSLSLTATAYFSGHVAPSTAAAP
ncbi:MAG: type 4a pilus biogenesis protein PilO [Acidimicrobiales bacterium]